MRVGGVGPFHLLAPGGVDIVFDAPDSEDENDHNQNDDS